MNRRPDDLKTWMAIAGTLIAAGIWLGTLQNRITQLEHQQRYEHGEPVKEK